MQLINIDKKRYRQHLNIVIVGFIITLLALSLGIGQLLIAGFGLVGQSNFKYNLLGVVLALLGCAAILHTIKKTIFFTEIYYVWQIKQIHNSIYRKLKKIKIAADNNEEQALIILTFYYQTLQQVYQLDDNTLTINTVKKELLKIEELIANKNLMICAEQFEIKLLTSYS